MVTILYDVDILKRQFDTTETVLIPIFSNPVTHPCNNDISLLYVRCLNTNDEYILPFNHSEATGRISPLLDGCKHKFVLNRKEFKHKFNLSKLIDINLLQYVDSGNPLSLKLEETTAHTLIKRNFPNHKCINRIIPISKYVESCRVLSSKMIDVIEKYRLNISDPSFNFLNFTATDVFQQIESAGIHVNTPLYKETFGISSEQHIKSEGDLVFSEYNLFTTTGRPSNRYGGINFAALNKEDGTRRVFETRFDSGIDNGQLVLFDYDAYHLRLIAELIGFKFPNGQIHEYLGKMYFKTNSLTPEQYEESKRTSFHLLYGGITDEYKSVPFFAEVQKFIDYLWHTFQENGHIQSPIGQRKLYSKNMEHMHPQKLFNYFIQLHETEHNVMVLERVLPLFHERPSKLILYTYDSFLVDLSMEDNWDFLRKIKHELECENLYPTKVFVGSTYHEHINITDRFQS